MSESCEAKPLPATGCSAGRPAKGENAYQQHEQEHIKTHRQSLPFLLQIAHCRTGFLARPGRPGKAVLQKNHARSISVFVEDQNSK